MAAKKLGDIWSVDLDSISNMNETWATRLVPLNKVFPSIPTRTQLRPIMVQSPIVKLLEARFLPKLQNYLTYKLDRSQVGFVQKMGVQVNLTRALERITLRTRRRRTVFGLFIDFGNAYNSVPHSLLFSKLRQKKILEEDEVCFLEQLYARYRIKLGSKLLRSNKGVAQGSVISPALFDIFLEDLGESLTRRVGIDLEDRLFYADDVLLFLDSEEQLLRAIEIVEEWARDNGMHLNKSKSGIVVFAHRRARKVPKMEKTGNQWRPTTNNIGGIPLCEKYKYLGTWLDIKLTCTSQINNIKKKAAHIYVKLYPYLVCASADARRDMWQTMVAPLFNADYVLLHYEPSETHRVSLERLQRGTFKKFLMVSREQTQY